MDYVADVDFDQEGAVDTIYRVFRKDESRAGDLPDNVMDMIHEEINRGKFDDIR
jgi:hypothetical protein